MIRLREAVHERGAAVLVAVDVERAGVTAGRQRPVLRVHVQFVVLIGRRGAVVETARDAGLRNPVRPFVALRSSRLGLRGGLTTSGRLIRGAGCTGCSRVVDRFSPINVDPRDRREGAFRRLFLSCVEVVRRRRRRLVEDPDAALVGAHSCFT
ncbi:hypothetical protein [Cellulomonas septica]|uniref:Uncharacterized protein n=1 Tax=Cellulomonas septica TaxID=285080 RepID=A0ABX1K0D5_9CELL|nr:hypothetical protein [Cellulomonas septica]NKY38463.1 hypothetical protein [Cellulomonas septica]